MLERRRSLVSYVTILDMKNVSAFDMIVVTWSQWIISFGIIIDLFMHISYTDNSRNMDQNVLKRSKFKTHEKQIPAEHET